MTKKKRANRKKARPPAVAVGSDTIERRILILAPTGNDARLTLDFLVKSGLAAHICFDVGQLCDEVSLGCGAIVLAEETLGQSSIPALVQTLTAQPSWSDIPLILITSGGEVSQKQIRRLETFAPGGNVTLLERPFRQSTLISTLEVAMRARRRQYEARRLMETLADAQERMEATLGLADIGTWTWQIQKDRVYADKNLARLFSVTAQDAAGGPIQKYLHAVHPNDQPLIKSAISKAMEDVAGQFEMDYRLVQADGTVRWVTARGKVERNAAGQPVRFPGVVIDITDRMRAEAALLEAKSAAEAANRSKDQFLAALSHELRTPLNPVLLVASENAVNPELPEKVRADFEMIRKNVELEARLIDDLLDLTRISHGKLALDKRHLDLRTILKDALATIQEEVRQKQISVTVHFGAEEHWVWGDSVRLQQVFWNVLKNSVKFTPAGGSITISTRRASKKGNLKIKITDTGLGLTPREISHIFNAFSQGEHRINAGPHRFGGLGLGLAISRMLVKLHSGLIYATSAGREKGATFTVELPFVKPEKNLPEIAPGTESNGHLNGHPNKKPGLRILLVEDHEATRIALAHLLTRREYLVTAANSLAEARVAAKQNKFDLVVSDIGLPDGDGYTLMSELRDEYGLKGIALSGYGMEQDVAKGKKAGFVAHLIKPVRVESLEKTLAEIA